MRVVGFDVGKRRTGVAVSDRSATIARPLTRLDGADVLDEALALVAELAGEEDGLAAVVVGVPRRLDGSATDATADARSFASALRTRLAVPVIEQDERLTSVEADERLAEREPDWRRRKARIDAAAAAVILQEYLDTARRPAATRDEASRP